METNASTPVEGWTSHTLFAYITTVIVETDRRYEQRFSAQVEAIAVATGTITALLEERDRRYEERHQAQQEALVVALAVVNKEFHEHIVQVREETHAALAASEKAITKAEVASDKRFEGQNEFRSQLSDQAATFMPRYEFESSHANLVEKVDDLAQRTATSFANIGSRLDLMTGRAAGSNVEERLAAIAKQIDINSSTIITEGAKAAGGQAAVTERRQSQAAIYAAVGVAILIVNFLVGLAAYVVAKP